MLQINEYKSEVIDSQFSAGFQVSPTKTYQEY